MVESFILGNEMICDHGEPYGGVAELGISDIERAEFEKSTSFSCA